MPVKYDKKYRATSVVSKIPREIHDNIRGKICYPAYFNVGERGWFICDVPEDFMVPAHRIHTSTVQNIEYRDNGFTVYTTNTTYEFTEVCNEDEV